MPISICPSCYTEHCYDCWGECDCPLHDKSMPPTPGRGIENVIDPKGRV